MFRKRCQGRIILSVIISLSFFTPAPTSGAEPITLAYVGPLTGPLATLGKHSLQGAKIAVQEINTQGGILGKRVNLKERDDACKPAKAREEFLRLIERFKILAIIGSFCTESILATQDISSKKGVLQLSGIRLPTDQIKRGGKSFYSRTYHFKDWARVIGQYLVKAKSVKKIDIISTSSKYRAIAYASMASAVSMQFVRQHEVPSVEKIRKLDPPGDTIFIASPGTVDIKIVKAAKKVGIKNIVLGFDPVWFAGARKEAEGIIFAASYPYKGKGIAFADKFRKSIGSNPFFYPQNAYDMVYLIAAGIRKAGSVEPQRVQRSLEKIKINGLAGPLTIQGNIIRGVFSPAQIRENRAVALEGTHGDGAGR